jgi:hypothetical protein
MGNFNNKEAVNINIYDDRNRLIHREAIKHDIRFSLVYNLDKITTKLVTVSIENDGELQGFTYSLK